MIWLLLNFRRGCITNLEKIKTSFGLTGVSSLSPIAQAAEGLYLELHQKGVHVRSQCDQVLVVDAKEHKYFLTLTAPPLISQKPWTGVAVLKNHLIFAPG